MSKNLSPDLRLVLDSLPQAVIVTDKNNAILYANMAAENVFRASSSYLLKHNMEKIVPFGSPVLGLVKQVMTKGAPVNEYQIDISSPY